VVDDGSTDSTPTVSGRYAHRIRILRQRNRGIVGARNRAVLESRSDLVALLDGDDVWAPAKLETCFDAMAGTAPTMIVHDVNAVSADLSEVLAGGPIANLLRRETHNSAATYVNCWTDLVDDNFIWTTSQ